MSQLAEQRPVFATSETRDWWRKCDGVVLVFSDGSTVHVHFCFATSEKTEERFDPDPKKGTWSFDRAKVIFMPDGSILVGPPGCKEGELLLLSVELADQEHVIYRFSDRFDSGLKFALLPKRVFQIVQARQSHRKEDEIIIQSGGKPLFVACCLVQRWVGRNPSLFDRVDYTNCLSAYMKDVLNSIGSALEKLSTPDGTLYAVEQLLGVGETHGNS